jgi:hypothetical protein
VRANLDKYPAVIHKIVACVLERIERERYVWLCCQCVTPQHTRTPSARVALMLTLAPLSLPLWDSHGELMDRSLLSSVCRMLVALGLYPVFEMAFLEHSELFYQAEGSRRAVSDDVRGDGDSECVCAPISLLLTSDVKVAHSSLPTPAFCLLAWCAGACVFSACGGSLEGGEQ